MTYDDASAANKVFDRAVQALQINGYVLASVRQSQLMPSSKTTATSAVLSTSPSVNSKDEEKERKHKPIKRKLASSDSEDNIEDDSDIEQKSSKNNKKNNNNNNK